MSRAAESSAGAEMSYLIASQILLWIAVGVLSLVVVALARQIGVLHERVAPVGALKVDTAVAVGQKSPVLALATLAGTTAHIGRELQEADAQLLLFVSPDCPICKNLIPVAKVFARDERLTVLFIGDGEAAAQRLMIERFGIDPATFVNSPEVGMRFGVGKLPYAVLIDDAGVIASAGLVNSREHLESLVVAKQLGFSSVQAYLRAKAASHEHAGAHADGSTLSRPIA
jgi:methylamine dehydrogenase accessory protein MauD